MSGLTATQAADRLGLHLDLNGAKERGRLAELLGDPGVLAAPAEDDYPARKRQQVYVARLRDCLEALACEVETIYPPVPTFRGRAKHLGKGAALGYRLKAGDRERLLAIAADLPDPPQIECAGPWINGLTPAERAIHSALLAAGDNFSDRWALQDALVAAVPRANCTTGQSIGVHLTRLRPKVRAWLDIEMVFGRGWRYTPVSLAAFLSGDLAAAPTSHLAPIKKGAAR